MFKKVIFAVLFLCFLCTGCAKQEAVVDDLSAIESRGHFIVGVREDAPPFGYRDKQGNLVGYDIDLSKIIAKNLLGNPQKIKFVPVTASDRIMKLNSGEVDMLVATMSMTNQRRMILDFSVPYYVAGQAILVRSGSKETTLRGFSGKKMIIVFGSTSERNLRENVPEISIIGYKTYSDAYQALKAGKADGMIADDTILLGYAINDSSVKLLPKRYSQEPYAIAFRKSPESQTLQTRINAVVDNLLTTGQLYKMQEKWGIKK